METNPDGLPKYLGRVTVFSTTGCPHCKKAKFSLSELSIPYVEINLEKNPERRGEMVAKAKNSSVPQIFFNDARVGGNDELQKVLFYFYCILLFSIVIDSTIGINFDHLKSFIHLSSICIFLFFPDIFQKDNVIILLLLFIQNIHPK